MPFLNGGKGRDTSYNGHRNKRFQKYRQRNSNKKQNPRYFICNGVRKDTFLVHH